jgi:hypothetical protein
MRAETLLDIFDPPEGMVGHSAALVAMTGAEDFLDEAMVRFTGLGKTQRSQLGIVYAYLMLDGHSSPSRKEVFPPGRIPGLHEFQPRSIDPGSLLHAKIALLAFAPNRTGAPIQLRLAVLTANFTYPSARQQLELVWLIDAPLDGSACPEDRADVVAAGAFVESILNQRFYSDKSMAARLVTLLKATKDCQTNPRPLAQSIRRRFIHSLDQPLYEQIKQRFERALRHKRRNLLLCGSGFYESPGNGKEKPEVISSLERLNVFTDTYRRVALVEPGEAGAVADWAREGDTDGWEIVRPCDVLDRSRRLHAKFVYAGYLLNGQVSKGWLYLGSGNLSRRGILSHGGMSEGNVESGVVFEVPERLAPEDLESWLFWSNDGAEAVGDDEWAVGQVGDAPDAQPILEAPPILSASIEPNRVRHLRLLWREDTTAERVSLSWTERDWFDVQQADEVPLKNEENPTALRVRVESGRTWVVPVVDAAGRVGWQPPRFKTYADALAALLDFPIRPSEATDDDDRDRDGDVGAKGTGSGESIEREKSYALHAAAELVEKVAALQAALPESMLDDWLDHLDRMFRASFPQALIATWRSHRLDVLAYLWEPELRPPHLTDKQRARYFEVLDGAARAWGLR